MKKIIILSLLLVITVVSKAQFYVGGSMNFDYNKYKSESTKTYDLTIEPSIGYCFNDNHSVELGLGYSHSSSKNEFGKTGENYYYIAPSYCYTIPIIDELTYNIYIGPELGFNSNGIHSYGGSIGNYLEYFFTGHWSLTGGFDILSLTKIKTTNDEYDTNFNAAWMSPGLTFGVCYYFN